MRNLLRFLEKISELKTTPRRGWQIRKVRGVQETIGAHSFGTAVLAWILAKKEGLDAERALKMGLVHDLFEAYTGDPTPHDPEWDKKQEMEKQALPQLSGVLPPEIKDEVLELLQEYSQQKTKLAKIVKTADRLDMLVQAYKYQKAGNPNLDEFFEYEKQDNKIIGFGGEFLRFLEDERK